MPLESTLYYFVRGLLAGGSAARRGEHYIMLDGRRAKASDVRLLIQAGILTQNAAGCAANSRTASWLKRAMLDRDAFLAQHRIVARDEEGRELNLAESPLTRLAAGESAFLERHQLEVGDRVRRLVERAQLRQKTTMNYSGLPVDKRSASRASDLPDLAADARRGVNEIYERLPAECAGVVIDVCGFLKGLQEVERERGWPRRSAKLVLRIGLEQLALVYGMGPYAQGPASRHVRGWLAAGARPEMRV